MSVSAQPPRKRGEKKGEIKKKEKKTMLMKVVPESSKKKKGCNKADFARYFTARTAHQLWVLLLLLLRTLPFQDRV